MVYVRIRIACRARIEMTTGALEVRPFTASGAVDMDAVHAWRRILYGENDLHHMAVAAIGDLVQRCSTSDPACALDRRARCLHRRASASLALWQGWIRGKRRRIWRRGISASLRSLRRNDGGCKAKRGGCRGRGKTSSTHVTS